MKRLLRHPWTQNLAARTLAGYLAFCFLTTRWRLLGAENLAPYATGSPALAAVWHERLPLMPKMWLLHRAMAGGAGRAVGLHVLVSRHRDGRLIGGVVARFGISVVHGSSSRGGASGARALVRLLMAGQHAVITPDGPRGPARVAQPGVAEVARLSGASVLPCAAAVSRCWRVRSWDRMVLPKPFARGAVVVLPAIAAVQADLASITAALNRACADADAACGTVRPPMDAGRAASLAFGKG